MSENQICELINDILSIHNTNRKQSEEHLANARKQDPNQVYHIFLNLIKSSNKIEIRQFASIYLRKNLSQFSEKSFDNDLHRLQPQIISQLKSTLFDQLEIENNKGVRNNICDLIGEIGGTFILQKIEWPELINQILQLLGSDNFTSIASGLRILSVLFVYASDQFENKQNELQIIFNQGLICNDIEIQIWTIKAFSSYIQAIDQSKPFEKLIPQLLQCCNNLIQIQTDTDILGEIQDIAESIPKFFKKDFSLVQECMQNIVFNKNNQQIKKTATEILISIVERFSSLLKGDNLKKILEIIFFNMVQIDNKVSQEWECPEEGFCEENDNGDNDQDVINFGMQAVNRIIEAFGQEEVLPTLSQIVNKMFQENDWRYKHGAIMALSQIGEYIDDIKEISPIVDLIISYQQDTNSKIRYSICHFIGQLSEDMKPQFQEIYEQKVLLCMSNLLKDQIQRVQSHAASCLTNFFEGMSKEAIQKYINGIFQLFFTILQNPITISIVKESIVSALSSLSQNAQDLILPFYKESFQFLFNQLDIYKQVQYKRYRGLILECITVMAEAVGYEHFQHFSQQTIQKMLVIQNGNLEDEDPQKHYLFTGWQRLSVLMNDNFAPYLQQVIPSLFSLIKNVLNQEVATSESEDSDAALQMLTTLIETQSRNFIQYIEPALEIVLPLLQFVGNDEMRKNSAICIPKIIKCTIQHDKQIGLNLAKKCILDLWKATEVEYQPDIIQEQILAISDIIHVADQKSLKRFLNEEELIEIKDRIIKVAQESEKRKNENESQKDDLDDEEIKNMSFDIEQEHQLLLALSELIGIIFKTHQHLPLLQSIIQKILPQALLPKNHANIHNFALNIINDIIQYFSINQIQDIVPNILDALLLLSQNKSNIVRQCACLGIGILAEKKSDIFLQKQEICFRKVIEALNMQQNNGKSKQLQRSQEIMVSALCRMIPVVNQELQKEVIKNWLERLPICRDKKESQFNHNFLAQMAIQNPILIQDDFIKIYKILAQVINSKLSNPDLDSIILIALKQHQDKFICTLQPDLKNKVLKCFN